MNFKNLYKDEKRIENFFFDTIQEEQKKNRDELKEKQKFYRGTNKEI